MELQTQKEGANFAKCVSKHVKLNLSRSYSEEEVIIINIILFHAMDSDSQQNPCPTEAVNCKNPRGSGSMNTTAKKGVDTKKSMFNNFTVLLL